MHPLASSLSIAVIVALPLHSCGDQEPQVTTNAEQSSTSKGGADGSGEQDDSKGSDAGNQAVQYALSLTVGARQPGDAYTASVETMESMPPQFAVSIAESSLVLKSKLDEVKPANDQRVIAVKISSNGLNDGGQREAASVRIVLGKLKVGVYTLQLFLATKGETDHTLSQTFELTAK